MDSITHTKDDMDTKSSFAPPDRRVVSRMTFPEKKLRLVLDKWTKILYNEYGNRKFTHESNFKHNSTTIEPQKKEVQGMKKWIPGVLGVLFGWLCIVLLQPISATGALSSYIRFATASAWIALFCIVGFLAYVVFLTKKR